MATTDSREPDATRSRHALEAHLVVGLTLCLAAFGAHGQTSANPSPMPAPAPSTSAPASNAGPTGDTAVGPGGQPLMNEQLQDAFGSLTQVYRAAPADSSSPADVYNDPSTALINQAVTPLGVPGSLQQVIEDTPPSLQTPPITPGAVPGPPPVQALKITPGIEARETYSTNVNLSSDPRAGFISEVQPTLRISEDGPNLKLLIDWDPDFVFYTNHTNVDTVYDYLTATATAQLVKNLLYVDAGAFIEEQTISPFGPQSQNDNASGANLAQTRTLVLSPYLRSAFSVNGEYTAGIRYIGANSNSDVLGYSNTVEEYLELKNSIANSGMRWSITANHSDIDYPSYETMQLSTFLATLYENVGNSVELSEGVGYDHDVYPATADEKLGGPRYLLGFKWQPNPTNNINVQIGHQDYGATALIDAEHRTRYTSFTLSYIQQRETSQETLASPANSATFNVLNTYFQTEYPDPLARAIAINNFITQSLLPASNFGQLAFLTDQLFLLKRLDAQAGIFGARNSITVDVYDSEQRALSNLPTPILDLLENYDNIRAIGGSAFWNYRIDLKDTATLGLQYIHNVALDAYSVSDVQRMETLTWLHELTHDTGISFSLRNQNQSANRFAYSYHENAFIVAFYTKF